MPSENEIAPGEEGVLLIYICGALKERDKSAIYVHKRNGNSIEFTKESLLESYSKITHKQPENIAEYIDKDQFFLYLLGGLDYKVTHVILLYPNTEDAKNCRDILTNFASTLDVKVETIELRQDKPDELNSIISCGMTITQILERASGHDVLIDLTHGYRHIPIGVITSILGSAKKPSIMHKLERAKFLYTKKFPGGKNKFEIMVFNLGDLLTISRLINAIYNLDYNEITRISKYEKIAHGNKELGSAFKKLREGTILFFLGKFDELIKEADALVNSAEMVYSYYSLGNPRDMPILKFIEKLKISKLQHPNTYQALGGIEAAMLLDSLGQHQSAALMLFGAVDYTNNIMFDTICKNIRNELEPLKGAKVSREELIEKIRCALKRFSSGPINELSSIIGDLFILHSKISPIRNGVAHPIVGKSLDKALEYLRKGDHQRIKEIAEDLKKIIMDLEGINWDDITCDSE